MIRNIATMKNQAGQWVDVFYNQETKLIYQGDHPTRIDKALGKADSIRDAEIWLENEFGSNVELN